MARWQHRRGDERPGLVGPRMSGGEEALGDKKMSNQTDGMRGLRADTNWAACHLRMRGAATVAAQRRRERTVQLMGTPFPGRAQVARRTYELLGYDPELHERLRTGNRRPLIRPGISCQQLLLHPHRWRHCRSGGLVCFQCDYSYKNAWHRPPELDQPRVALQESPVCGSGICRRHNYISRPIVWRHLHKLGQLRHVSCRLL